jgi:hypothetical protein
MHRAACAGQENRHFRPQIDVLKRSGCLSVMTASPILYLYDLIVSHHTAMPSQSVAQSNCDDSAEALSTFGFAELSSAKNLIPTVSSAAYNLVEIAVRSLTKTSRTELSRQTRMRRASVSSVPVVGLRVVKRVCGALSGLVLIRSWLLIVRDWKEGRVMAKVSVVGVKDRVVVWEKSVRCQLGCLWLME